MALRLPGHFPISRAVLVAALLLCRPVASQPLDASADDATGSGPRSSVLLIVVDTLRADHLGCYGYARDTSPHIDSLAARGVRFEHTISQSSWTLPSMISLMMGRYVLGLTPLLPGDSECMAELFSARGYQTAAFVANGVVSGPAGFTRGFDVFRSEDELDLTDPENIEGSIFSLGEMLNERVLGWAADHAEAPFFLYVHYMDPHRPYMALEESPPFVEGYDPIDELRNERYGQFLAERPDLGPDAEAQLQIIRDTIRRYDADVSYVDARIGELFAGLEALGLMEDTVVALASDHGEGLYDHQEYSDIVLQQGPPDELLLTDHYKNGHGRQLYQELVTTPLIFAGPGIVKGRVVPDVVANVSLLPTLLEAATGDVLDDRDGSSLMAALSADTFFIEKRSVLYSWCIQTTAVVHPKHRLKLLRPNPAGLALGLTPTLFDLFNDPGEDRNALLDDEPIMRSAARFLEGTLVEKEKLSLSQAESTEYLEATRRKMRELGYIR